MCRMKPALRIVSAVFALAYGTVLFGFIDLGALWISNPSFSESTHLEASWGSLLTFFGAIPLATLAVRPRALWATTAMLATVAGAVVAGAFVTRDPAALWLALVVAVNTAAVLPLGLALERRGALRLDPIRIRLAVVPLLLAIIGTPLWGVYVVHAAGRFGGPPVDLTLGLDHWPIQVATGIAVVLASFAAALLPVVRPLATSAAALSAAAIGVGAAAYPHSASATESPVWGIAVVFWGVAMALALAVPGRRAAPPRAEADAPAAGASPRAR